VAACQFTKWRGSWDGDLVAPVLGQLAKLRAVTDPPVIDGDFAVIVGNIPAGDANTLQAALPGLTSGEGSLNLSSTSTSR